MARKLGVRSVFLQPINEVGRAKENGLKRVEEEKVFKKFVQIYKKYDDLDQYIPGSLDVQHFTSIKMFGKVFVLWIRGFIFGSSARWNMLSLS